MPADEHTEHLSKHVYDLAERIATLKRVKQCAKERGVAGLIDRETEIGAAIAIAAAHDNKSTDEVYAGRDLSRVHRRAQEYLSEASGTILRCLGEQAFYGALEQRIRESKPARLICGMARRDGGEDLFVYAFERQRTDAQLPKQELTYTFIEQEPQQLGLFAAPATPAEQLKAKNRQLFDKYGTQICIDLYVKGKTVEGERQPYEPPQAAAQQPSGVKRELPDYRKFRAGDRDDD